MIFTTENSLYKLCNKQVKMGVIQKLTRYTRVGNAFVNAYSLIDAGDIKNLKAEDAIIKRAYYGKRAPCLDGTPAPRGLNIDVMFGHSVSAGLTFIDSDDIIEFMQIYGVKNPKELVGKKIKTYNQFPRLVGLEPIVINSSK